jgi:hypothetical protein
MLVFFIIYLRLQLTFYLLSDRPTSPGSAYDDVPSSDLIPPTPARLPPPLAAPIIAVRAKKEDSGHATGAPPYHNGAKCAKKTTPLLEEVGTPIRALDDSTKSCTSFYLRRVSTRRAQCMVEWGFRRVCIPPLRAFPFLFGLLTYFWSVLRGKKNRVRRCRCCRQNLTTYEEIKNAIVDTQERMVRS